MTVQQPAVEWRTVGHNVHGDLVFRKNWGPQYGTEVGTVIFWSQAELIARVFNQPRNQLYMEKHFAAERLEEAKSWVEENYAVLDTEQRLGG